ncbi:MAG: fibronectin type III domain-containing protein [Bacteroidetes bacterium]|nr:fibronectin type III domain-containing protein [Bacteroidota bacterium]
MKTFFTASDCGVPTNLASSDITCNEAKITWIGAPGTISFVISYKQAQDTVWTQISTTNLFYNFTGLSLGTTYQVRIKGICALCESAYSATISFLQF